jgi:predicted unusual protein kinase regulating ubiquinone biosynthesis (AarF/ABC1/UbiB family)
MAETSNRSETSVPKDAERNRLSSRMGRYAQVGTGMGGIAAKMAAGRLFGRELDTQANAAEIAAALGQLKGPIMKVAQLVATIPDAVPPEYAAELSQLQNDAPPMGKAFVKRRMVAELGRGWESKFEQFDKEPVAAASLGQVHRAKVAGFGDVAVKLQYPDMASAVEADIGQLNIMLALFKRVESGVDPSEIKEEIAERVREELDYEREAKHAALYLKILQNEALVTVPRVHEGLSTKRMLVLEWLDGKKLLNFKEHSLEDRNRLATAMFRAWWHPFAHYGVIHGDPHLGNYTAATDEEGRPTHLNLLDYGCIRIFPPDFVQGVIDLYHGILENDRDRLWHAYETWGFKGLTPELADVLTVWARFIYGPLLDDRVRSIADGISPGEYGRKEAFKVHQELRKKGPVTIPREFVFMDRAAIGLGSVFLHLGAEMNFYKLFNEEIEGFQRDILATEQSEALTAIGLNA